MTPAQRVSQVKPLSAEPGSKRLSRPFPKALCLKRGGSPLPRSPSSLFVKVNAPRTGFG
jgi:hypothetical protein